MQTFKGEQFACKDAVNSLIVWHAFLRMSCAISPTSPHLHCAPCLSRYLACAHCMLACACRAHFAYHLMACADLLPLSNCNLEITTLVRKHSSVFIFRWCNCLGVSRQIDHALIICDVSPLRASDAFSFLIRFKLCTSFLCQKPA